MDCISTVAGEVNEPKKTLPLALSITVLLCMISILFPLGIAAGNST